MSTLVIKDLPDSLDLDSQAMAAITGGARLQGRQSIFGSRPFPADRIINYPGGVTRTPAAAPSAGGRLK